MSDLDIKGITYADIDELFETKLVCYQCDKTTKWLAPDGRCAWCTSYTPEEIRGEVQ
jgi:rRNA maturation endonuclease Nob1